MINYSELNDYEAFEDLCEVLLDCHGIKTRRLGRGPGQLGKDIVGIEKISGCLSDFKPQKWLVECKFTKANGAIDENDVINISDRIIAQKASGYLLFTNARLRVNLEKTLNGLSKNNPAQIKVWTEKTISTKVISNPEIFRKFFPESFQNWIYENRLIYLNQVKKFKEPLIGIKNDLQFISKAPIGKLDINLINLKFEEIDNRVNHLINEIDEDLKIIKTTNTQI